MSTQQALHEENRRHSSTYNRIEGAEKRAGWAAESHNASEAASYASTLASIAYGLNSDLETMTRRYWELVGKQESARDRSAELERELRQTGGIES